MKWCRMQILTEMVKSVTKVSKFYIFNSFINNIIWLASFILKQMKLVTAFINSETFKPKLYIFNPFMEGFQYTPKRFNTIMKRSTKAFGIEFLSSQFYVNITWNCYRNFNHIIWNLPEFPRNRFPFTAYDI